MAQMPINVHPSLLPKLRGIKPLENAIINGDSEIGVTLHELVMKLDAGRVVLQEGGILLNSNKKYSEVYEEQGKLITRLLIKFFNDPDRYLNNLIEQDESQASEAPRLPFAFEDEMTLEQIRKNAVINS